MERLSSAIQIFHDEILNLQAQVNAMDEHLACAPEDKAADTLTNKLLQALAKRLEELEQYIKKLEDRYVKQILIDEELKELTDRMIKVEEICEDGAEYVFKQSEHEFHTRIKMLERQIYGYEARMGLNSELEALEKKLKALEDKVNG